MKKYLKVTPEGARDYLFKECSVSEKISDKIKKCFRSHGYERVDTPCLEFYDLFSLEDSGIPQESMIKTTDNKGRIMVLRPDSTLPIARMAVTRLMNSKPPLRVFYGQTIYKNNPSNTGRSNEIMQMGVELFGATGFKADIEIITTSIDALCEVSDNFRIEIGHAEFFNSLLSELKVSDDISDSIRYSIESKNFSALNNILDSLDNSDAVKALRTLPQLFGGEEVLDEATKLCKNSKALEALSYLRTLYKELSKLGLGDNLTIDLGLVQRNNYYSGIIFCGYVEGSGEAVVSGGRYDKLLQSFDSNMGAAGFGINTDILTEIKLKDTKLNSVYVPDTLVYAIDGHEIDAIKYVKDKINSGVNAQFCVIENIDEAKAYATDNGIKEFVIIGE